MQNFQLIAYIAFDNKYCEVDINMVIINGTGIADEIKTKLKNDMQKEGICPSLAIILLGDNKQDSTYVALKKKAVEFIGGKTHIYQLPINTRKEDLLGIINMLNQDDNIDGILLQLPLPDELESYTEDFLEAITSKKDVDGFNPINRGRLTAEKADFVSCAALAGLDIIHRYNSTIEGKKAVLLGDSFDLIIPLAVILIKSGCRVNVIPEYQSQSIKEGDILILEKGAPGIVKSEDLKKDVIIIDAGFHWHIDHIMGNVDKDSVKDVNGYLLPVPGGLGPVLIAKLMENLCLAARENR
jgi:methylenetetrahydrofolate dehydrogenase (NADP+)/methenyltetrahydrofolate cyclohydrolase